jgi:hypothetical protein
MNYISKKAPNTISINLFIREIFVCIITGAIPVWVAWLFYGKETFDETITSLLSPKLIIDTNGTITATCLIVLSLELIFIIKRDRIHRIMKLARPIIHEAATCFISVLRVGSGVILGYAPIWFLVDYNETEAPRVILLTAFSLVTVSLSFSLTFLLNHVKENAPGSRESRYT